jgi:ketosteroid isomerase-like protein
MSQENEEILRQVHEAWNRGDFAGVIRHFDREVDFRPGLLPPGEESHYRGHDGVKEWIRAANDVWVRVTVEAQERREIANGLLAIDRWRFEGRDGIEVVEELPTAITFRDGLIVRVEGFTDRTEAFRTVGLSE